MGYVYVEKKQKLCDLYDEAELPYGWHRDFEKRVAEGESAKFEYVLYNALRKGTKRTERHRTKHHPSGTYWDYKTLEQWKARIEEEIRDEVRTKFQRDGADPAYKFIRPQIESAGITVTNNLMLDPTQTTHVHEVARVLHEEYKRQKEAERKRLELAAKAPAQCHDKSEDEGGLDSEESDVSVET